MHELSLQYLPALPQAAFVPYCTRHFCFSGALCSPPPSPPFYSLFWPIKIAPDKWQMT